MLNGLTRALAVVPLLAVAACGSQAAGTGGASTPSPSPSDLRARNGTQGELVRINAPTLVVNAASGDVTVAYDSSTTFSRTSTGTFADITAGRCVIASGPKDAAGMVTASSVRLSEKVNGACTPGAGGPGGGPTP